MTKRLQSSLFKNKCFTKIHGFKGLILFMVIITIFHLLYKIVEQEIIQLPFIIGILDVLIYPLLYTTTWVLNNFFGVQSTISKDVLLLPNQFSIQMLPGCSGLQQYFLVLVLFTIYPGPPLSKLWYIPLAFIVIYFLNTIRFIGISLFTSIYPGHFHLVHDWIFRPFIYFIIFLLWIIWDSKIYQPTRKKSDN